MNNKVIDRKTIKTLGFHRIDKVKLAKGSTYRKVFKQSVFYNCYRNNQLASVYQDLTDALRWASTSHAMSRNA